jgi:hypothetical protein
LADLGLQMQLEFNRCQEEEGGTPSVPLAVCHPNA